MSNNNKNDQLEENFQVNQNDYAIYDELLEKIGNIKKGTIMSGVVRDFDNNYVFIDLGLKADGKIPKDEFYVEGHTKLPEKGEAINVLLESLEDVNGNLVVSYSKALRQEKWEQLEQYFQKRTTIEGTVVRKVNGGCIVNVLGIGVFLPKTHFIKDVKDSREMIGKKVSCTIIKMDYAKRNIIVSAKSSNDMEILSTFSEKQIVPGVVKSISESYALVELTSGVLGKLNIKDISWNKIENINDILTVGQTIQVKIMNIFESSRIELSMKDIEENPWIKTLKEHNLEKNMEIEGIVTRISDKFMNIKIKDGISGSVHISETAWMKKFQNFDCFKVNKVVKAKIININSLNNDLVLSIKELEKNSIHQFKIGEKLQCKILGNSELGYIVSIHDKIHGIIPNSSYYLDGSLQEGQDVGVYVHSTKNQQLILGTKAPV